MKQKDKECRESWWGQGYTGYLTYHSTDSTDSKYLTVLAGSDCSSHSLPYHSKDIIIIHNSYHIITIINLSYSTITVLYHLPGLQGTYCVSSLSSNMLRVCFRGFGRASLTPLWTFGGETGANCHRLSDTRHMRRPSVPSSCSTAHWHSSNCITASLHRWSSLHLHSLPIAYRVILILTLITLTAVHYLVTCPICSTSNMGRRVFLWHE